MPVLEARELSIRFGGLLAVDRFEFKIEKNELVGLIGPNGAGKTTIFNLLTGVYKPTEGQILVDGKMIDRKKPNEIVMLGSSRTFQNIRLFKNMSVMDNIRVAYHNRMSYGILDGIVKSRTYYREEAEGTKVAMALLEVFHMEKDKDTLAKNLPYGKQRKLEICRALATKPKILLLDEPAAGMNPQETEELMRTIRFIKTHFDLSILLIEHDMRLVMGICERIVVLDYGRIIASGLPAQIRLDKAVIKAYLGE
jgi:branched-chain amino acid transport system ATP-binding protein